MVFFSKWIQCDVRHISTTKGKIVTHDGSTMNILSAERSQIPLLDAL